MSLRILTEKSLADKMHIGKEVLTGHSLPVLL